MTAYMLLYAAHPFLNMIIEKLPQNRLFALSATLMVLYTGINFIKETFFSSRVINYISGLSLLIYIIHENVIVRTCLRAFIWHYVYNRFGFDHLFLIIFIYTVALFAASMAAAAIYRLTLERFVVKAADKATPLLSKAYHKIEDKAMKKK
ncbi:MAG: hypothetical protein IK063_00330 [Clostridia bacterium]|nr:hypothetical protein [Clostridia bacterium]